MLFYSGMPLKSLAAESPVVVMGRGHSGTRVLAWALQKLGIRMGATAEVATGDVQDLRFSRAIKRVCRASLHLSPTADVDARLLIVFQKAVGRYRRSLSDDVVEWGWKFPETYLIPNYVAATFPGARYIHMIRDGRDIAFKHHLTDDQNRRLGRRLLAQLSAIDLPHHVQAAMSWDFQVQRFDKFVDFARPPVHTITFEALCQDPLSTFGEVCQFLRRPMTDECREYLSTMINPGKISQYRHEDPVQVAEAEAAMAATLAQCGYTARAA